jgi:hypothetical protein
VDGVGVEVGVGLDVDIATVWVVLPLLKAANVSDW